LINLISYIHPGRTFLPSTGVGRHVNNILLALKSKDNIDLSLVFSAEWLKRDGKLPENAPLRALPFHTFRLPERIVERSWKALNWPKMDSYFEEADWVFSPAETYIPLRKVLSAVTLHDIQAFEKDLPWSGSKEHKSFNSRWKFWIPKLIKNTELVFTVSEYSRKRLVNKLNLAEDRVKVSGNAVDAAFIRNAEIIPPKNKGYPYLTVIGGLRPKKGGKELLKVAKYLQKSWPSVRLVTWGENDPKLLRQASELHNIVPLDMLSDVEMTSWLKGSQATLFLSWYEGFGLPVLESMACGTPVICSNKASIPEVAGDAALMASPDEIDKIEDYILQIKNTSLGNELKEKGYDNIKKYSWEKCADNIVQALKGRS